VLRLLEVFRPEDVLAGVREAIARGAIGFDAVKHLVLCRIERRPPRLDERRLLRLQRQLASYLLQAPKVRIVHPTFLGHPVNLG